MSPTRATSCSDLLEDAGARARIASSAGEAIQLLEQGFVPDIILSDIGMPDQDGYDFMQQVRRMDGEVAEVPAAALTALARLEDRKRALMAGYQTHLAKAGGPRRARGDGGELDWTDRPFGRLRSEGLELSARLTHP